MRKKGTPTVVDRFKSLDKSVMHGAQQSVRRTNLSRSYKACLLLHDWSQVPPRNGCHSFPATLFISHDCNSHHILVEDPTTKTFAWICVAPKDSRWDRYTSLNTKYKSASMIGVNQNLFLLSKITGINVYHIVSPSHLSGSSEPRKQQGLTFHYRYWLVG